MTPAEIALAATLAQQGITYWTNWQARLAAGNLTRADLVAAASQLNTDLAALEADMKLQGSLPS